MTEMPRYGRVGVWRVVERKCISRGELKFHLLLLCEVAPGPNSGAFRFLIWLSRMSGMIADSRRSRFAQSCLMKTGPHPKGLTGC